MRVRGIVSVVVLGLVVVAVGPPLASRFLGWGADRSRLPSRGHTIPISQGLELNVVEVGKGPPVVLVHGLPSSAYDWAELPRKLASHGYRAIAYDRVGYGYSSRGSTAPERYTYESNARDLLALMDALSLQRAPVVGWSYGGAVVQTAATISPERFPKVVLLAAVGPAQPRGDDPLSLLLESPAAAPVLKWIASVPPLSKSLTGDSLARAFAGQNRVPRDWLDYERAMLSLSGTLDAFVLEAQRENPEALHPEKLTMPTLIIEGSADELVPPPVAADLHRRIPGSRLVTVPDGSHMLPVEKPDQLAQTIDDFLRDGEAPPTP